MNCSGQELLKNSLGVTYELLKSNAGVAHANAVHAIGACQSRELLKNRPGVTIGTRLGVTRELLVSYSE